MDSNRGYVIAGYATTFGVLTLYTAWLRSRIRRARRSAPQAGPPDA